MSETRVGTKFTFHFPSGELTVRTAEVVTVTSTAVGEGWWMARASDGREGILPEAYVERIETRPELGTFRKSSTVTSGWGDDWDSEGEEEHKYEDPKDLIGPDSSMYSVPVSSSAPALSNVETSTNKPAVARPVISRPPPPASFSLGKFTSVFGKSNQVGEYLSGLTESSATLAREAVLVSELNKVKPSNSDRKTLTKLFRKYLAGKMRETPTLVRSAIQRKVPSLAE